jgi:aminoglycoside phosphotransferase (APT) family kinase protein
VILNRSEQIDETALYDWLGRHLEGFEGPAAIEKFAEGQSNPTYRLETTRGAYVLRRQPFGTLLPSAHAVDREFRILKALSPLGFPVPKPMCLCPDRGIIGAMFYVMELVHGRTFVDGDLPTLTAEDRRTAYEAMVDTLAFLHSIDPIQVGLSDYGRPGNYFSRQIDRWIKQYRASETERIAAMEQLIDVLPKSVPPQSGIAIVHGDFRIDNVIFSNDQAAVQAVIDWELSTLGDPLADFSYFALNWVAETNGRSSIAGLNLESLGIPSLEQTIRRYCARAGREAVPAELNWYFSYNLFRLASIIQGIKRRAIDGSASSEHAADFAERVPALAQAGCEFFAGVLK